MSALQSRRRSGRNDRWTEPVWPRPRPQMGADSPPGCVCVGQASKNTAASPSAGWSSATHTHTLTRTLTHAHSHTHAHTHSLTHACSHMLAHTHSHTHAHIRSLTHTRSHTHARSHSTTSPSSVVRPAALATGSRSRRQANDPVAVPCPGPEPSWMLKSIPTLLPGYREVRGKEEN